MSWSTALTEAELAGFKINGEIERHIEQSRSVLGLEKSQMRILDWGCGRGEAVAHLAAQGYDAYGVDIDAPVISRGESALAEFGFDVHRLKLIQPDGSIDFPNDFFHFVYSYQVLEHVEDLERVVSEIYRVTASRGSGLHIYPGNRRIIEGHLFMPFVHWLPKNRLRWLSIYTCTLLGIEPRWIELGGEPARSKANTYYKYSVNNTYYRTFRCVERCFEAVGFTLRLVIIDHPRVRHHQLLRLLLKTKISSRILEWLILTFQTVQLAPVKQDATAKLISRID